MKKKVENDKLWKDWLFLVSFFGGIFLGSAISCIIIWNENLISYLCFSAQCFSNILIYFKFPLSLAAAGITLSGLRAVVFRSEQAARQLDELCRKNTFTDFLDHKKVFFDLLKSIEEENSKWICFKNKEALYRKMFGDNSPTQMDFVSNTGVLSDQIKNYNEGITTFKNILEHSQRDTPTDQAVLKPISTLMWVCDRFYIELKERHEIPASYLSHFAINYNNYTTSIPLDFRVLSECLYSLLKGLSVFGGLPKETTYIEHLDDIDLDMANSILGRIASQKLK